MIMSWRAESCSRRWLMGCAFIVFLLPSCVERQPGTVITATKGAQRVLLVPSFHLSPDPLVPPAIAIAALSEMKVLAVESDPTNESDAASSRTCIDEARTSIPAVRAPKESIADLQSFVESQPELGKLGDLPDYVIANALLASQLTGWDPVLGLDLAFINQAKRTNSTIVSLERPCDWVRAFQAVASIHVTPALLAEMTLDARQRTTASYLTGQLASWRRGDVEELMHLQDTWARKVPLQATFMLALHQERNATMARRIEEIAQIHGGVVVTVGMDHIISPGSLPKRLAEAGWHLDKASTSLAR